MAERPGDSIFWIETEKIKPNPFQPRREFDDSKLAGLADSIRQYGILQPLVVTRLETEKEDGGMSVEYELIAGERRLRGAKKAGLTQVPVVIRTGEESDQMKLELAIIENLQREDLNPIDRARAFQRLATDFKFKHNQIAQKVGKSREYVSNSMRLLLLPPNLQEALAEGAISEGHGRPLLMLNDRFPEQQTLFKEITAKKLTVREAEAIARRIATDKVRKKIRAYDPEILDLEQRLTETLGTRVQIETREVGGKIVIDFFSNDDLRGLLQTLNQERGEALAQDIAEEEEENGEVIPEPSEEASEGEKGRNPLADFLPWKKNTEPPRQEKEEEDDNDDASDDNDGEDLYSLKNFSI